MRTAITSFMVKSLVHLPIHQSFLEFTVKNLIHPATLTGRVAGPSFTVRNDAEP